MILTSLNKAIQLLDQAETSKQDQFIIDTVKKRVNKLEKAVDTLTQLVEIHLQMEKSMALNDDMNIPLRQELMKVLEGCYLHCEESARDLSDEDIQDIGTCIFQWKDLVEKNWRKAITKETEGILGVLNSLKNLLNDPIKVDRLAKNIERALNKTQPDNAKDICKIMEDISSAKKEIDMLKPDEEIEKFLQKIQRNTATIFDINDHVQFWIKKNHLEKRIKVSFL